MLIAFARYVVLETDNLGRNHYRCLQQKAWKSALVVSTWGAGEGAGRDGYKGGWLKKKEELPREELGIQG